MRNIVAHICPKHGFQQGEHCPECVEMQDEPSRGPAVHTDDWVKGIWEHIDAKPIKIESKAHLFAECAKRGHIPKAFMKPKSQGSGWELKRR